ncbi:MAG TPA: hypothetical protein DCP68_02605 [Ruminococcus sp.]|nr:hypothetical protein [Ruminococcus sp.]
MKLISILTALICACLLAFPVYADDVPEQTDLQDAVAKAAPVLLIDNAHIYTNMQQSYAQGYEPLIDGNDAVIVLPLICEDDDKPDSVRISARLTPESPFIVRNYEQTVPLGTHTDSDGNAHELYLAEFRLALRDDRMNGSWPVLLETVGSGAYTVYVNITDGKDLNADEPAPAAEPEPIPEPQPEQKEEPVVLMPKILVQSVAGGSVQAGETAELHISLKNTSRTEALQNLTVTAAAADPLILRSADTLYFERVKANAEFEAVYVCHLPTDAAAGTYTLPLQFDFAYGKGMTGSGSGNVSLTVTQPVKMEFPQVVLPAEAVVSDRLELHIQAINLGVTAVQNVRAELTCDGLLPEGIAFIGAVSGGTSADCVLNVQVSSRRGAELYGDTAGQIVFTYEDESGIEHSETQEIALTLKSPFSERRTEPKQASPNHWVWIMTGIGGGILLLSAYLIYRYRKRVQP